MRSRGYVVARDFPEFADQLADDSPYGVNDIVPTMKTRLLWKCECGRSYEFSLSDRKRGRGTMGCRGCALRSRSSNYTSEMLTKNGSFLSAFPWVVEHLNPEHKNPDLGKHVRSSAERASLICGQGHRFTQTLIGISRGNWCPECAKAVRVNASKAVTIKKRSLSSLSNLDEFLSMVDGDPPNEIWTTFQLPIICEQCGERSTVRVHKWERGDRCSVCAEYRKKIVPGHNDLATTHPDLVARLSPMNDVDPTTIKFWSMDYLLFRCSQEECGMDYHSRAFWIKKCPRCAPLSNLEEELFSFLSQFSGVGVIVRSDRSIITPKELDFYFPDLNKAIEFNGNYWHSDRMVRDRGIASSAEDYHRLKLETCAEKGVELVFAWEDDWNERRDEVERALSSWLSGSPAEPIITVLTKG